MIPASTAQEALLLGTHFGVCAKVEVEASSSTSAFNDLSALAGANWIESIRVRDSVDQRVASADISVFREQSSSQSLSPMRNDSTLNQTSSGGDAFIIDVNRDIKISVATVAASCSPVSTDYQMIFHGEIDSWDVSENPMEISARDLGGMLMDRWVEAETAYGTSSGTAIETVMQAILDDALGSTDVALETSTTPGFLITPYEQRRQPILTALQTLADLIGWVVRYRWSTTAGDFTLQFFEPARTSTTPHSTFSAARYIKFPRLAVDRADIRNVVAVRYPSSTSNQTEVVTVESSSSIDRYGRMWMAITEPADSPIDTSTEATAYAQACLDDLSEPDVEQSADMHIWPLVELGDLYRWSANDVHYNADQDLAVVSYQHELARNSHRTQMDLRGKARSGTKNWIEKGDSVKTLTLRSLRGAMVSKKTSRPSSNNLDGWIEYNYVNPSLGGGSWADVRGGVAAPATDWESPGYSTGIDLWINLFGTHTTDATPVRIYCTIARAPILFNTGTVPPNSILIAGFMTGYTGQSPAVSEQITGDETAVMCGCSLADITALSTAALADYQSFGNTAFSEAVYLSGVSTAVDQPVVFTLTGQGLAAVNKGGVTQFGLRLGSDIKNQEPTSTNDGGNSLVLHSAENGSSSLSPTLTLYYI